MIEFIFEKYQEDYKLNALNSRLKKDTSGLLIIDIQERINAVMKYKDDVIQNTIKLIRGFQILNLPIFITEQYPKGLGPTEKEISELLSHSDFIQKMTFSCCQADEFMNQIQSKNIHQIVICGIETHVCVQQTALDLLRDRFQVYIVRDATSSRKKIDHKTALNRMQNEGAVITTTEAVLFELLQKAGTDDFKKISAIVK